MGDVLDRAVAALYRVFADYRSGTGRGCPCCVTGEADRALHGPRLRDVPGDALDSFAMRALSTWGTMTDVKHFLPRILELYSSRSLTTPLQIVYSKIVGEQPWPDNERRAVEEFTQALLVDAIENGDAWRATEILESAGIAGFEVKPLLDRVFARRDDGRSDPRYASVLADLVERRANVLSSGSPTFIWWRDAAAGAVDAWLLGGSPYAILYAAFETNPDHPDARSWAAACDILEALGGAKPSS